MVSFREKWLTLDALCHAKFTNHHCWFDTLALIMQTGYEVGSLSEPVISRINDWAGGSISDHLGECRTSYAIKTTWFY